MSRKITVTLTEEQWLAIESCAECAANTYNDALAVLGAPARVHALTRGLRTLRDALREAGAYDRFLARSAR